MVFTRSLSTLPPYGQIDLQKKTDYAGQDEQMANASDARSPERDSRVEHEHADLAARER